MATFNLCTNNNKQTSLGGETIDQFRSGLRGILITHDSPDYDTARTIWNAMVDKRPGLIVKCAGTADVIHTVKFAKEYNLLVAVKGAGHNIAGNAMCDGGLVIDLSMMKSVRVDPVKKLPG